MKNVIIPGASGNIAKHVIDILVKMDDINLTLFLRNKSRLRNNDISILMSTKKKPETSCQVFC
jgi:short-subunit dehydrogenase